MEITKHYTTYMYRDDFMIVSNFFKKVSSEKKTFVKLKLLKKYFSCPRDQCSRWPLNRNSVISQRQSIMVLFNVPWYIMNKPWCIHNVPWYIVNEPWCIHNIYNGTFSHGIFYSYQSYLWKSKIINNIKTTYNQ